MTLRAEAQAHLRKARQFLESAHLSRENELYDAAASSAVLCGINCKDAICLAAMGTTSKSEDHTRAVKELRQSGRLGAELAPTFSRLLGLKTPSQYLAKPTGKAQADRAIEWAQRMYNAASGFAR